MYTGHRDMPITCYQLQEPVWIDGDQAVDITFYNHGDKSVYRLDEVGRASRLCFNVCDITGAVLYEAEEFQLSGEWAEVTVHDTPGNPFYPDKMVSDAFNPRHIDGYNARQQFTAEKSVTIKRSADKRDAKNAVFADNPAGWELQRELSELYQDLLVDVAVQLST